VVLVLAGIDDPKLDSTAFHPSSSFHSLPRRVLSSRAPCADEYGWSGSTALVHMLRLLLLSLSVGRQSVSVSAKVTPKVSHQFRLWFRLQPLLDFSYGATFGYGRNQKNWFRSVSSSVF